MAAAEALEMGEPFDDVQLLLTGIRTRARVFAMMDTLEYVRRSGRVSWARASIGALLQIKPFIELIDGKALNTGESRTRRKGIQRLYVLLEAQGPLERLAVLHTNAEQEAHHFLEQITQPIPHPPLVVNITPVIGNHIGPNSLGFAVIKR
jgi:DegV family protein with EDD domain